MHFSGEKSVLYNGRKHWLMLCKTECKKGAAAGAGKEGERTGPSEVLQVASSSCSTYTSADCKELLPVELVLFSKVNSKQKAPSWPTLLPEQGKSPVIQSVQSPTKLQEGITSGQYILHHVCVQRPNKQLGLLSSFSLGPWLLFMWCWHCTDTGKLLHKHHAGHSGEHKMGEPSHCRSPCPACAAPAVTKICLSTFPCALWFPPLLLFLFFHCLHEGNIPLKP